MHDKNYAKYANKFAFHFDQRTLLQILAGPLLTLTFETKLSKLTRRPFSYRQNLVSSGLRVKDQKQQVKEGRKWVSFSLAPSLARVWPISWKRDKF